MRPTASIVLYLLFVPGPALATAPGEIPSEAPDGPPSTSSGATATSQTRQPLFLTIRAPDGDPLPPHGSRVRLERQDDPPIRLRPVDGRFVADAVPPGAWRLTVLDPSGSLYEVPLVVDAGASRMNVQLVYPDGGDDAVIEVRAPSEAEALARSSEAVSVVDTERAQEQSADLGEVMARSRGVSIRRSGGAGSSARLSLAGFTGQQVRLFLDGMPLDAAGYPLGLGTVPVDLIRRVEVYRGVVPVRLGADALGGAVNLVTETGADGSGGSASYQLGSFDTHRLALQARHQGDAVRVTGSAWLDHSANDYNVQVEVPDAQGRLSPTTVRRFHDAYTAAGGAVEVGLVDRAWADRLTLRAFGSTLRQEIQHNTVMTLPYGEPVQSTRTFGSVARYTHRPGPTLDIDAFVGGSLARRRFEDVGACIYDWFGLCIGERGTAGEVSRAASDRRLYDRSVNARAAVGWTPDARHRLQLTTAVDGFSRTGEDLRWDGTGPDPASAQRDALHWISAAEHRLFAAGEGLEQRAFVKHYLQAIRGEEPIVTGGFQRADRTAQRLGVGDGLRIDLTRGLRLKVSYEWATRLPSPVEVFGDGALIQDNLDLAPETSHNANLSLEGGGEGSTGRWTGEAHGSLRRARDLIILLGSDRNFTYDNVFEARSLGAEAAAGWASPGDWVGLDLNGSVYDIRNVSDEGAFESFKGDRIPNLPWMMANGTLSLGLPGVIRPGDRLSLQWHTRYVHGFFRGWESAGASGFKQRIPAQLSHSVVVTWRLESERRRLSASLEVQNLTDAALYDFFGVQRPGRAAFGKLAVGW